MRVKFENCPHPKCGVRMQRLYVRDTRYQFVPVGWKCPDCGVMIADITLQNQSLHSAL